MYNNFHEELLKIGKDNKERAELLGVTTKSIARYKSGQLPSILQKMQRYPQLLRALADDADITQKEATQ